MTDKKPSYQRSTSGLRNALFDEIQDLRDGIATPQEARALADLAGRIVDTLKIDLAAEYAQLNDYHKNDGKRLIESK